MFNVKTSQKSSNKEVLHLKIYHDTEPDAIGAGETSETLVLFSFFNLFIESIRKILGIFPYLAKPILLPYAAADYGDPMNRYMACDGYMLRNSIIIYHLN